MKKSKDTKSCLKQNNDNSASYGGTSFVELDCAEALASYCPKRISSVKTARTVACSTNKNLQTGSSDGFHDMKSHFHKPSSKTDENEKLIEAQMYSYRHKHDEDSSNSDFGLDHGLHFNLFNSSSHINVGTTNLSGDTLHNQSYQNLLLFSCL